ncbi:unnamed protein product, partial [Laminaria digitata]
MSPEPRPRILSFQPSKKGSAHVDVPVLRQLSEELEPQPRWEISITTAAGQPFALSVSMCNKIQKWTVDAGSPKRGTHHGVRKGVAELLAAAGATQYENMA